MNENLTIIINVGIPGSGKSTDSLLFLTENKNYVKVSRDDFRYMLRNEGLCEYPIEKMITKLEINTIKEALDNGYNVIVDDTNVKISVIETLISELRDYADIKFKLYDVPMETCVERDKLRIRKVGEDVIRRMNDSLNDLKKNFDFKDIKKTI